MADRLGSNQFALGSTRKALTSLSHIKRAQLHHTRRVSERVIAGKGKYYIDYLVARPLFYVIVLIMITRDHIITLPNPHLRQKSKRVHVVTEATNNLISDMQMATLDWEDHRPHELGVALAAVQINRLERVVIIRNDFDNKDDRTFVTLINPQVIKVEGDIVYDHEGCLSVPDLYGLVPRHNKVRIRAMNDKGHEVRIKAEGFLARVLQHEIDHTNGIVFIDHIKDQDAFFRLTKDGKLKKVAHATVVKNNLLW